MSFYSNEKIEQRLDLLHHMLQFGDELLLVSGKEGVGKSRQLQELMHRLGEGWQICHLSGRQDSQISQLFERVSQSFGYDYSSVPSAELLSGFQHHLEQRERGKTYALLIDDAEFLDESTLEVITHLCRLQNSKGLLLRVALFGGPALNNVPILKTVALREVAIESLDSQQSQGYIDFCITQGRFAIGQSPSPARQQQIVKRAEGLPGQIEAMLQTGPRPMDGWKKILDWRVAAVLLLLLAVGMGYLLNRSSDMPTTPATASEPPLKSRKFTMPQQPVIRKPVMVAVPDAPAVAAQQGGDEGLISDLLKQAEPLAAGEQKIQKFVNGEPTEPEGDSTMAPLQMAGTGPEEVPRELSSEPPTKTKIEPPVAGKGEVGGRAWFLSQPATSFTIQLVAAGRETSLDELIRSEGLQSGLARFSFVRDARTIHVLTQGVYTERAGAEAASKRYSQRMNPWIRPMGDIHRLFAENPAPEAKAGAAPAVSTAESTGVKDAAWIWSQDPESVTIQLMAGGNRQMLQSYESLSLKRGVTAIVESKRKGRPWYVLLHGRYPSRQEARSAIAKLPQPLQAAKPWVRSFASVHDELSQAN